MSQRIDLTSPREIETARLSPMHWNYYTMRGRYLKPAHLRYLNERIVATILKPNGRLMIEQPPRTGKSKLTGIGAAGWCIGAMPDKEVAYCSATLGLGRKHGRLARADMGQHGEAVWGLRVSPERNAAADWGVVDAATGAAYGGGFRAYGVGSQFVGEGADLLLFDDLVKDSEAADSEIQKEALWDWIIETAWDRMEPGASCISIEHRWREDDPHGKIRERLAHEGWEIVSLPMVAGDDDVLGRAPGECLWPERYTPERVEVLRQSLPPRTWAAKFQQAPSPADGSVWRRAWWENCRYTVDDTERIHFGPDYVAPLSSLMRYTVLDLAFTEKKTSDYTTIGTYGLTVEDVRRCAILGMVRERMEYPRLRALLPRVMEQHGSQVLYVEDEGQQKMVIQDLRDRGMPVKTIGRSKDADVRISGDKVNVAHEATPFAASGRLWFPLQAHWVGQAEHELLTFPNAAHDDVADNIAWGCHIAESIPTYGFADLGVEPEPSRWDGMAPRGDRARGSLYG